MTEPSDKELFLGLDLGTSGARAVIIDKDQNPVASASANLSDFGSDHRSATNWWAAAKSALVSALATVDRHQIKSVSVDGTSGTMVAVDRDGNPLAPGIMYNDPCTDGGIVDRISNHAPDDSAALGATSALARAMQLRTLNPHKILHQADWISHRLSGQFASDDNNALKTGFDPRQKNWPEWIEQAGMDMDLLPSVMEPGTVVGPITDETAAEFDLSPSVKVVAGTTDGCASFLATGANRIGEAVTALGTTLTLKILSDKAIFAPQYGIYSHKLLGMWLAGGASNTGGNVLAKYFTNEEIGSLSRNIDADKDTGFDYYPLSKPGERFPISDPDLQPRLAPRPDQDHVFLHGLLEGIANVEALAYARLEELGAPALTSVCTVGGGASNEVWRAIRTRKLGVEPVTPKSTEAAYGTALLAMRGWENNK